MEEILLKASQLLLSLSILIVLHELGHFVPAKLFGIKVEKFYLFFDWKFSLFKVRRGETEYGIGWIPLGGYVKIAGMIDESMDKEQMQKEPEAWEFRSKPAWQRLIVMVGGVTVNVVLAFFIYSMILFAYGTEKLPMKNATYGLAVSDELKSIGMQDGDVIKSVGSEDIVYMNDVNKMLIINDYNQLTVTRNGEDVVLEVPADFKSSLLEREDNKASLVAALSPFVIADIQKDYPAAESDLQIKDAIVTVNGVATPTYLDAKEELKKYTSEEITLEVDRNGSIVSIPVGVSAESTVGILPLNPYEILELEKVEYGFFASFPAGVALCGNILSGYVRSMKLLFTKAGVKQIGGFATLGNLFSGTEWDWRSFWNMTAFISLILAFMNILPIPALDGGHVMFLLYEMITKREPNQKVLEYAQMVGMILILGLLVLANGNDIYKLFN